jgi:hypothetical protein
VHVLLGVHHPDRHLGSAEIDADGLAGAQEDVKGSGIGMRKY